MNLSHWAIQFYGHLSIVARHELDRTVIRGLGVGPCILFECFQVETGSSWLHSGLESLLEPKDRCFHCYGANVTLKWTGIALLSLCSRCDEPDTTASCAIRLRPMRTPSLVMPCRRGSQACNGEVLALAILDRIFIGHLRTPIHVKVTS